MRPVLFLANALSIRDETYQGLLIHSATRHRFSAFSYHREVDGGEPVPRGQPAGLKVGAGRSQNL